MSNSNSSGLSHYEMMQALDDLKGKAEVLMEQQAVIARLKRNAYNEYLAIGFTEDQALKLCGATMLGI